MAWTNIPIRDVGCWNDDRFFSGARITFDVKLDAPRRSDATAPHLNALRHTILAPFYNRHFGRTQL
jgi:hypothetical protein